jgi:peptidyl-prolyl cis-trans isomerase C
MKLQRIRAKAIGVCLGVASLGLFGVVHATGADVVAKVGDYEIKVNEVQKRLAEVPLFQLKNMGDTPSDVRTRFVEEIVKLEIMVQGARLQKLDNLPDVDERIRSVMVSALLNDLANEAAHDGVVSDEKVREFYEANAGRYLPQQRIMIWHIEVKTKVEAEKLLVTINSGAEFKDEASFVTAWDNLARTNSIDKSTYMRKGNLGFVQPDGSTAHKDVSVPKAMFDAAATIKNGQVYPEPLQVESSWVVLARRGSHDTAHRTLESETTTIRGFLAREHVMDRRKALVERLRATHMKEKNERVLEQLTESNHVISVSRRPGALREARAPRGKMKPVGKPGNLR